MTKTQDLSAADFGMTLISLATSVAVLLVLIVSALGVKLWWFKHRLNFNHSDVNNNLATQAMRETSKDKRLSQQFLDTYEVRGVFRKRQEDEINQMPHVHALMPQITDDEMLHQSRASEILPPKISPTMHLTDDDVPTIFATQHPVQRFHGTSEISFDTSHQIVQEQTMNELRPKPPARTRRSIRRDQSQIKTFNGTKLEYKNVDIPTSPIAEFETFSLASSSGDGVGNMRSPDSLLAQENSFNETFSKGSLYGNKSSEYSSSGECSSSWCNIELNAEKHNTKDIAIQLRSTPLVGTRTHLIAQSTIPAIEFLLQTDPNDVTKFTWAVERQNSFVRNDEKLWQYLDNQSTPDNGNTLWLEMEQCIDYEFTDNIDEKFSKTRHSYELNEASLLESAKQDAFTTNRSGEVPPEPQGFGRNIEEDWDNFTSLELTRSHTTTAHATIISTSEEYCIRNTQLTEDQQNLKSDDNCAEIVDGYVRKLQESTDDEVCNTDNESDIKNKHRLHFQLNINENDEYKGEQQSRLKHRRTTEYILNMPDDEISSISYTSIEDHGLNPFSEEKISIDVVKKVTFDMNTEEYYLPADHWREYAHEQNGSSPVTHDSSNSDEDNAYSIGALNSKNYAFITELLSKSKIDDSIDINTQCITSNNLTNEAHEQKHNLVKSNNNTTMLMCSSQISIEADDNTFTIPTNSWRAVGQHRLEENKQQQLQNGYSCSHQNSVISCVEGKVPIPVPRTHHNLL